ncbi:MAG: hypothetical protein AAGF95_30960 [Chloroflexota bacterium]
MLKKVTKWVVITLTLIVGLGGTLSHATPTSAAEPHARLASSLTICKGQPIPSGYVIVGERRSSRCPGYFGTNRNMWVLRTPGSSETVCKGSPIPSGYVIVSERRTAQCPSYFTTSDNAWAIKRI